MARPKAEEKKVPISISLKPSILEEIEKISRELDLPRNRFIENLVEVGLDDAKLFSKLGIYSILMNVGNAARKLRGKTLSEKITWNEEGDIVNHT